MSTVATMVVSLLAKTEQFEKSMNAATKKISAFQKEMQGIGRIAGIGGQAFAYAKIAADSMELATAIHEANREGEKFGDTLLEFVQSKIPMVGSAIKGLAAEFSGLNEAVEKAAGIDKAAEAGQRLSEGLRKEINVLRAPEGYEKNADALNKYQDTLKEIGAYEAALRKSGDGGVAGKTADAMRAQAKERYDLTIKEIETLREKKRLEEEITAQKKLQSDFERNIESIGRIIENELQKRAETERYWKNELDKVRTPLEEYYDRVEEINKALEDQKIEIDDWIRLEDAAGRKFLNDMSDPNTKQRFESGQFMEYNPSEVSVSGLAIRGASDQTLQDIAKSSRQTAINTGKNTGATI